jgi:YesN/AraC family two-component response regulator
MGHHTILCVDDEDNILCALERAFLDEKDYEVITANGGEKGLEVLKAQPVDLIIADQRMTGMTGVEFLKRARKLCPDAVRIVLSGYSDFDTVTAAINEGEIYRLIQKPWKDDELRTTVRDSLEKYELMRENEKLHEAVRRQNEELKALNLQLEERVRQRTEELLLRNQTLLLYQEMLYEVPSPTIGISSDYVIVFINKNAQRIYEDGETSVIGRDVEDVFPKGVVDMITKVFDVGQPQTIHAVSYKNHRLTVTCLPLSGQYAGKGVILETDRRVREESSRVRDSG